MGSTQPASYTMTPETGRNKRPHQPIRYPPFSAGLGSLHSSSSQWSRQTFNGTCTDYICVCSCSGGADYCLTHQEHMSTPGTPTGQRFFCSKTLLLILPRTESDLHIRGYTELSQGHILPSFRKKYQLTRFESNCIGIILPLFLISC